MMCHKIFEQMADRLAPVNLKRDPQTSKKEVSFPKGGWKDKRFSTKDYAGYNSVALRTGRGIVGVDVDTKDLTLLEG